MTEAASPLVCYNVTSGRRFECMASKPLVEFPVAGAIAATTV